MRAHKFAPFVLAYGILAASPSAGWSAGYDELNAGINAYNRGEWASAVGHFGAALTAGDLNPDQKFIAHLDRADAHFALHALDDIPPDLAACLEIRPADPAALDYRAKFYMDTGRAELALPDLDALVAANPDDSGAYLKRGKAYQLVGNHQKAIEDFDIAQAKAPNDKGIVFNTGLSQMELGQLDRAAESFAHPPEAWPGYAWLWLAITDLKQGKPIPSESQTGLKGGFWPAPLVDYFNGKDTEAAVLDMAKVTGQLCDANFYIGEFRLLHGDVEGKRLVQKALNQCTRNSAEWFSARWILENAH